MNNKEDDAIDAHYQDCPGCLCNLRSENEQLKKTILSSSDLYDKLVTKQLHAERELADELAKALSESMKWWDNGGDYSTYAQDTLKKYTERRRMESDDEYDD